MNKELADSLREALKKDCPYATGQLHSSIQEAQPYGTNGWIITIGNGSVNGMSQTKVITKNGKSKTIHIVRKVPSNAYAAATNNAKTLRVFAAGKRDDPKHPKFTKIDNPNYHWANKAIQKWVDANGLKLVTSIEEVNDEQI